MIAEADQKEFEALARPLIKFLNDKTNPHFSIIIDTTSAELMSGECAVHTTEYVKD